MRSLRVLKYLFFTIIALFFVVFLALITSNQLTQKIFEYVSSEFPLKYSKVEGSLYSGIKVENLNYDDMVKAKSLYIKPSLLSLLVKEIYIYDLKIEEITLGDKLFLFINELNKPKEEEKEESSFDIPFSLFIKNFEATLYNFAYEEQKIDEVFLKAKNLSSNLKDTISGDVFTNIKSNLANIQADINLDNNNYKIESRIDLKEYVKSLFLLQAKGNLEKVDFSINSEQLKVENIEQKFDIKDFKLLGNYDIKNSNLEISSLNSNLKYGEIFSNIEAKAKMLNNDIDSLNFNVDLKTTIKKSIYEALQRDIEIKSNLTGNLKEIKFKNVLASNQISIDKTILKIEDLPLNGAVKIDNKNIDIFANLYLKEIGNIKINSSYKKDIFKLDLESNIVNLKLDSKDFKKIIFDLDIKNLNPNNFYELDKSIKISKIKGKIKGEFKENLSLNADLVLNDSFFINSIFKTKKDSFEATVKNSSIVANIDKNEEVTNIKTNIKELKNLEVELNKILEIPALNLLGSVDSSLQISPNSIDFELSSPKISQENESLEKINIKGKLKNETIVFDKLDFIIGKVYDINLEKNFTLLKPAFFNISNFNGNFEFDNILLKTLKQDKNILLNIVTKNLFLEHSSYGNGFLNSNLHINIDEESKILISGDIKVDKLKAFYNIPALSISKDKDIIIVSKKEKLIEKDYFLENIALDLSIQSDDIKYSVKNIDLKAKVALNIKKEFSKSLRIYGSVHDVAGTFSELGKTYTIDDSSIHFKGLEQIDPILDIKASTKVEDIQISILISGTLSNPRVNLNSNPMMNQKDILSYLIFGTNFASDSKNLQSKQSQASLFLLNELSKDYAKELGVDMIYFQYDPTTQYIETHIGKNIGEKNKVVLKNKSQGGQIVLMRELTKLWNVELGFEEKTQSLDLIYKRRY
ncbi:autotransporter translocation and assembly factor TamB [Aliarcobacter faecis]|uniref:translocation/assembly module TamB domain-containing protein n=1 Tax=Aliarcobacter faecis TaxID=1564138 RepID=UPI00047B0227|nr:translocation/assembly module TamB domain-containing protein [Aliarcobacter faecis]QKF73953.1 autotransporter translocation and assembly factor TamB [Aliarcobacter faecis]